MKKRYLTRPLKSALMLLLTAAACIPCGCVQKTPEYGHEVPLIVPGNRGEVWAIAPAINLSGQREVDPLLQSDILYQQLQEVRGLTVLPVDKVVEAYVGLKIQKVQSPEQASQVCEALGCDALVVATVTAYDPYDPPKFGGSLAVFHRSATTHKVQNVDPRDLAREAAPPAPDAPPSIAGNPNVAQAVGMFDANNGSVRDALFGYAKGRNDPVGPLGQREYLVSMDRYTGFAYHTLIEQLFRTAARPSKAPIG
jgi:hypothetical protein